LAFNTNTLELKKETERKRRLRGYACAVFSGVVLEEESSKGLYLVAYLCYNIG
jgi:hypothetical protein